MLRHRVKHRPSTNKHTVSLAGPHLLEESGCRIGNIWEGCGGNSRQAREENTAPIGYTCAISWVIVAPLWLSDASH